MLPTGPYTKFRLLDDVARIIFILTYIEMLNHVNFRDWLHLLFTYQPKRAKTIGWDQTQTVCVTSARAIPNSMPLVPTWNSNSEP